MPQTKTIARKKRNLSARRLSAKKKAKAAAAANWRRRAAVGAPSAEAAAPTTPAKGPARACMVSTPQSGPGPRAPYTPGMSPIREGADDSFASYGAPLHTPSHQDRSSDASMLSDIAELPEEIVSDPGTEREAPRPDSGNEAAPESPGRSGGGSEHGSEGGLSNAVESDSESEPRDSDDEYETDSEGELNVTRAEDPDTDIKVTGRRIVDIQHLWKSILGSEHPGPYGCNFANNRLIRESRRGFKTTWTFKCRVCGRRTRLSSEAPDDTRMQVNDAAVNGIIAGGAGYAQLAEVCASLDVPCMTNNTFTAHEKVVSAAIAEAAMQSIEEAAAEEYRRAAAKGLIDSEGHARITVVADGFWTKRSYHTGYAALTGIAVIVGAETGKILFLGIRNRYCSICAVAKNRGQDAPQHKCYLNWTGSASSMEADIIAEGFLQSTQLNLKYSTIIADNDSSVYPRLMALQPYGPQCPVKKIECKNHLSRNYRKNLKAIGDRTEFPLLLRKFLQSGFPSRHVKIVNAMWTAALHWKDSNLDLADKIDRLRRDIINAPYHYFGRHANCGDYFCQGPKEGEVDMVENCLRPENRKFWDAVVGLANHYAGFADSLIYCLDNNLAERFNNVVAQKINGKRVNHNQRGGVLTRGLAAVASVNTSGRYHEAVHRAAVGAAPLGNHTASFVQKKGKRLHARRKYRERQREVEVRVRNSKAREREGPNQDYGRLVGVNAAFDRPPLEGADLQAAKDRWVEQEQAITAAGRADLERETRFQAAAGTGSLWDTTRRKSVSATKHKAVADMRDGTSRRRLVHEIRYKVTRPTADMNHGVKFEPEAIEKFTEATQRTCVRAGIFLHQQYPWISCSPDMLVDDDAVGEVKCPPSVANFNSIGEAVAGGKIKYMERMEDGSVRLKRNSNHYFQIQANIHITGRTKGYFVVYNSSVEKNWLYVETIAKDDDHWAKTVPKLNRFYFEYLLPEIVDPQYGKRFDLSDIRDPPYRSGTDGPGDDPDNPGGDDV